MPITCSQGSSESVSSPSGKRVFIIFGRKALKINLRSTRKFSLRIIIYFRRSRIFYFTFFESFLDKYYLISKVSNTGKHLYLKHLPTSSSLRCRVDFFDLKLFPHNPSKTDGKLRRQDSIKSSNVILFFLVKMIRRFYTI